MAYLFGVRGGENDLEADFAMFGEPPPELREYLSKGADFELWPENELPLSIFIATQTQWRQGPAGPSGMDYTGVESALRLMRIEATAELFQQIRLMERTALDCLAKD